MALDLQKRIKSQTKAAQERHERALGRSKLHVSPRSSKGKAPEGRKGFGGPRPRTEWAPKLRRARELLETSHLVLRASEKGVDQRREREREAIGALQKSLGPSFRSVSCELLFWSGLAETLVDARDSILEHAGETDVIERLASRPNSLFDAGKHGQLIAEFFKQQAGRKFTVNSATASDGRVVSKSAEYLPLVRDQVFTPMSTKLRLPGPVAAITPSVPALCVSEGHRHLGAT
jgi:hypothetical protein